MAVMLSPVTPSLSRAVYTQLGFSEEKSQKLRLDDAQWGGAAEPLALLTRFS